jgi:hypothetical protein
MGNQMENQVESKSIAINTNVLLELLTAAYLVVRAIVIGVVLPFAANHNPAVAQMTERYGTLLIVVPFIVTVFWYLANKQATIRQRTAYLLLGLLADNVILCVFAWIVIRIPIC